MSVVVNTNIASIKAQRYLNLNTQNLNKTLERLSSGKRINSAKDDAAGLQISQGLKAKIRGANQAIANAQDGSSLLSVAEGAMNQFVSNLQRIRELTVQAANDTNGTAERAAIASEITALNADITRIKDATSYNNKSLFTDSNAATTGFKIQVGDGSSATLDTINIGTPLYYFGTGTALLNAIDVSTSSTARAFLTQIDTALTQVTTKLSKIGAFQNQLDGAIQNLSITQENFQAAHSRITDTDVAKESANLTRYQVLQQASVSILSQANQQSGLALSLIR